MYDKNNRSLFEKEEYQPLADKIRPNDFNNIYGQTHIIGEKKILSEIIKSIWRMPRLLEARKDVNNCDKL